MILRRPIATIDEIDDLDLYHVESAYVSSDDLSKRILRVKTDHGNEFGIRLEDDAPPLERGMVFNLGDRRLLAIETIPDKMLVVKPRSMDEMGHLAHYLGNLHKPVEISHGTITLLYDPVVDKDLVERDVVVEIVEMELDHPLRHIDLTKMAQGEHHHHPDHFHEPHHHHHEAPHHHHRHEGRLREEVDVLDDRHHEHAEMREIDREERRALREAERHDHVEHRIAEDASEIGERHRHHPVRHLEEDAEELGEHHREHADLRRQEREEWLELEDSEHHRHRAHPRTTYPRDPRE